MPPGAQAGFLVSEQNGRAMTDSSRESGTTHDHRLDPESFEAADYELARSVFAGLSPRQAYVNDADAACDSGRADATSQHRFAKTLSATVPIILVGSMAMSLNLSTALEPAQAKRPAKPKAESSERSVGATSTAATTASTAGAARPVSAVVPLSQPRQTVAQAPIPSVYRVVAGDTVADIAAQFGLSTPSVLALNGLSWSSLIFPGQELALGSPTTRSALDVEADTTTGSAGSYTIVAGDTISAIAERFGVSTISVLMANGLGWSSIIYPGQHLVMPGTLMPDGTPSSAVAPAPDVIRDESSVSSDEELIAENASQIEPSTPPASEINSAPPATSVPPGPPASPELAPPTPTAPQNGTYTIVAGDTISGIASRFGVSTQALLDANGLTWSSVIYGGQSLIIPGVATPPSTPGTVPAVAGLTEEMATHARTIIQVGRELAVPDYGIVIALATAMQESSLRNLNWGDRDSVGLFQQRPSSGWGSIEQLTTPSHAARLFYGGPSNPNRGYTRGLLDIRGWESMSLTQAAQAVQISGHPDAYAKWEQSARAWFAALG
jgi:N-acetylmuramoyl-L-alanine amidase